MAFNKESFEHFWQHLDVLFGKKVDKVAGKGLSSNDFTNEDKEKLASLKESAQSDWNVNDENDPAYVKNRTHYAIGNILYDVEIYITQQEGTRAYDFIDGLIPFESDKVYTIIWDGVNYECTSWGDNNIVIGNYAIVGNPDNFENSIQSDAPFVILVSESTFLQIFGDNGKHTLKIIDGVEEVKQLDEKYIPDIIARVEDIKTLSSDPRENGEENPKLSAVPINADLLGGKLPSEYLSKNEQAIDSAKLGGKAPEYYAKQETVTQLSEQIENIGTPNLLVNSNFQAPYLINLNGKKEYTGIADVFNEWRTWEEDSVVTIHDGYISHTKALYQYVKSMDKDKIYTFAVKNTDGVIHVVSGKPIEQPFVYPGMNMAYDNNQDLSFVRIWPDEGVIDLVWAVLYEGTYTAETLPTPIWLHPRLEMIRMGLPVNPVNLLDNSYWKNPKEIVNQRGYKKWTPEVGTDTADIKYNFAGGYTIDRWEAQSGISVSIGTTGLVVKGESAGANIIQFLANLPDGVYTFAAKINGKIPIRIIQKSNGTISTIDNSQAAFTGGYISVSKGSRGDQVLIYTNLDITNTIEWAAFYEGAYTAETLPPYVPKGYTVELAECQRYFERLGSGHSEALGNIVYTPTGAKAFMCSIQYHPKRIAHPDVILNDPAHYRLLLKDAENAAVFTARSITNFDEITTNSPFANFRVNMETGLTVNSWVMLQRADSANDAWIDISADL